MSVLLSLRGLVVCSVLMLEHEQSLHEYLVVSMCLFRYLYLEFNVPALGT